MDNRRKNFWAYLEKQSGEIFHVQLFQGGSQKSALHPEGYLQICGMGARWDLRTGTIIRPVRYFLGYCSTVSETGARFLLADTPTEETILGGRAWRTQLMREAQSSFRSTPFDQRLISVIVSDQAGVKMPENCDIQSLFSALLQHLSTKEIEALVALMRLPIEMRASAEALARAAS